MKKGVTFCKAFDVLSLFKPTAYRTAHVFKEVGNAELIEHIGHDSDKIEFVNREIRIFKRQLRTLRGLRSFLRRELGSLLSFIACSSCAAVICSGDMFASGTDGVPAGGIPFAPAAPCAAAAPFLFFLDFSLPCFAGFVFSGFIFSGFSFFAIEPSCTVIYCILYSISTKKSSTF